MHTKQKCTKEQHTTCSTQHHTQYTTKRATNAPTARHYVRSKLCQHQCINCCSYARKQMHYEPLTPAFTLTLQHLTAPARSSWHLSTAHTLCPCHTAVAHTGLATMAFDSNDAPLMLHITTLLHQFSHMYQVTATPTQPCRPPPLSNSHRSSGQPEPVDPQLIVCAPVCPHTPMFAVQSSTHTPCRPCTASVTSISCTSVRNSNHK